MPSAPRRSADRALLRDRPAKSKAVKQAAVLSEEQISALLAAAGPRDAALIALMTAGACRVGEATLLTWADVDACTVTVPGGATKSGCGRTFTLPPTACRYLREWRDLCPATRRGWLFPGRAGQPLSIRAAQYALTTLAEGVGLEGVSSHSLRRSAITAAADAGLSLKALSQVSGHQSLSSLQRYIDGRTAKVQAEAARGLLFGEG
jgi:integrase/recombinase XerD